MRGEKGEIFGRGRGRRGRPKFGPDIRYRDTRAPYKARSWTPLPSPQPRLRAAEDTFSVGKGGMQDTLSPGKGDIQDTFCAGKGGARASSGLVVLPRQALGDPVADPTELC